MKKRLDRFLVENGLTPSRQRAQALIMAGKVCIGNRRMDKPGVMIDADTAMDQIRIDEDIPYVSRGGLKLAEAIDVLGLDVKELVCMDVGASTGGFTDCLLQKGAKKVYAVDVGYGQLAWKLRNDARVILFERTNIRNLPVDAIPCRVDLITIDVSFISLKIVVPVILKFVKEKAHILALIKPQFEVGKGKVGKGGVVRDSASRQNVIENLSTAFEKMGLSAGPVIPSPIRGPKGNQEFIIYLKN